MKSPRCSRPGRRHCEYLERRRPYRAAAGEPLRGDQACRGGLDQGRRARVRQARHSRQFGRPRDDRHRHGRPDGGQSRRCAELVIVAASGRSRRRQRRNRRCRPLPCFGRRKVYDRHHAVGRRRMDRCSIGMIRRARKERPCPRIDCPGASMPVSGQISRRTSSPALRFVGDGCRIGSPLGLRESSAGRSSPAQSLRTRSSPSRRPPFECFPSISRRDADLINTLQYSVNGIPSVS